MTVLRTYIREVLSEANGGGKKKVYRGMIITMPSTSIASQTRKFLKTGRADIGQGELVRFILAQLEGESAGVSWSENFDVAVSFAKPHDATNRGKRLHVIFQATVDEEAGYDPQAAGEEPGLYYDEEEVRFESGTEIPLTGIYVFIRSKNEWDRLRTQFKLLVLKSADNPIMVRA